MVTNSWQYYLIPSLSEQLCCSLVILQISYIYSIFWRNISPSCSTNLSFDIIQLGNNGYKVSGKQSKLLTVPSYKRVYVDGYNRNSNGTYRFNDSIAGAPSRPYGTKFEGSSVAYRFTNVLVVRSTRLRQLEMVIKTALTKDTDMVAPEQSLVTYTVNI